MTQPTIEETLKERGSRYGEFDEHARITQNIKAAIVDSRRWAELDDDMRECLEMIAHKIGRIVNGDPTYIDSWTDIIGYTRLVEKRLIDEQSTAKVFAFPMQDGVANARAGQMDKVVRDPAAMAAGAPVKSTDGMNTAAKTASDTVADNCNCVFCIIRRDLGIKRAA